MTRTLGIGEAIVTVMNERGAPTPVARTGKKAGPRAPRHDDDSIVEEVVKSKAFKQAMNTAVRELVKGLFGEKR